MKKMRLTIIMFFAIIAFANCQDDTFKKVIHFEKGFTVGVDSGIQLEPYLGSTSNIVYWNDIPDKPEVYPPDMSALPTIELQAAISELKGLLFPKLTQAQIDALTPTEGLEVYNLTTHCKQYYNGTVWKTIITSN